jgi:hypothetical protein
MWDDRDSMFGEVRPLVRCRSPLYLFASNPFETDTISQVLHFFLADDTAEVLEVHRNNSGRDPFPVFLRRRRIPKVMSSVVTGAFLRDVKFCVEFLSRSCCRT